MNAYYVVGFLLAFLLSVGLTPLIRKIALHFGVMDKPDGKRKIHTQPIARLGGLAIFAAFTITVLAMLPASRQLATLLLGSAILATVGAIDDIRGLKASTKLIMQVLAAGIVLSGGIGITAITNPFGGSIDLTVGRFAVDFVGFHFHIAPIANLFSILWMVGLVNAINFMDGLDGLAAGVSSIAALSLFILAISVGVNQPLVALVAIVLAGSTLGFLPFNFYPAKIFMGDSGAYFLGMTLALLAMYSGGKLATVTLVLGFTILDALWAAIRRIKRGGHPFTPDREHLHHLLLGAGLSQRNAVLILYAAAALFGVVALLSNSFAKLIAFIILFGLMAISVVWLARVGRRVTDSSK